MPDPKPRRRLTKAPVARGARALLAGINPASLNANGRALLASARAENRPIAAMAVPKVSDLAKALTQGGARIPSSARPIGPVARANAQAASIVSGSDVSQVIANANRPAGPRAMRGPIAKSKGPFVPTVRLNPLVVRDTRNNTPTEKRAGIPRRSGASSSTTGGPRPSPRAIERANQNARFKRGGARPN